ncbi:hypothetical protein TrRE_jg7032 [Triparma retinervis]|uniref:Uncharacterized protein n=1 Tax=Triparma retinervis TaxID=2557542 RepID=A0A9W7A2W7_9STRA|nr:hypothetical protein TrRE_jg7032 [Triparma retinervis]
MGSFVFKTYELPMGNKTMFLALILLRAGVMIGHTVQKERFDFYKANLAMGFLFFLTAHFSYPLSPPTFYTNYAMPFWYALGFLWHTSSLISPTTSFFVFLAYVSYGIGISAWLLAKGNPQTRASSQYLALVAFLTPCGGWAIGTLLMQMRTSSTFWKSIALQCCSTVILSIAHPSALRASDKDKFAILMFGVYLGVDIGQTLLFLEVKLGTLEFFKCVIVQELAGIWKNSGVKEFCLFIVGRRKINPFRDEDYVSVLMKKGMVDTMSEVLAVISVLVMFLVEKALLPYTTPVIVTKHQVRNDTVTDTIEWEFESPVCVTTCAGWVASDGLEEKEDKSATGVTALVVVVLVFRFTFMFLERYHMSQLKFNSSVSRQKTVGGTANQDARTIFASSPTFYLSVISFAAIVGATGGSYSSTWSELHHDERGMLTGIEIDHWRKVGGDDGE